MLDALIDRLDLLAALVRKQPRVEWGTVSTVAPISITLDGDAEPLAGVPSTLVASLTAGDRVMVIVQRRRATIIGRGGGPRNVTGRTTVTAAAGVAGTAVPIVFPPGAFTAPPRVFVTPQTGVPANVDVSVRDVTKDGFNLFLKRTDSSATGVDWLAVTA